MAALYRWLLLPADNAGLLSALPPTPPLPRAVTYIFSLLDINTLPARNVSHLMSSRYLQA